jgi:uncharacterized protein (DUF58 family)
MGLAASAALLLVVLITGAPVRETAWATVGLLTLTVGLTALDFSRSRARWRGASPRLVRRLPAAFAIGVRREISLGIEIDGALDWHCEVYDHADASLAAEGLPLRLDLTPGARVSTSYAVVPLRRGTVTFAPAEVRVPSRWRLCELLEPLGVEERAAFIPTSRRWLATRGWPATAACRRSASRAISSAARAPTSSSCPSTASATRSGISTGVPRCA